MIQLYKVGNNNFEQNGDHVLIPEMCELERKLNGSWELKMEHPIDEGKIFEDIIQEAIIKTPTPEGDKLFYIYDVEKVSEDAVEVRARPVFLMASKEVILLDVRPTNKNGQEALDMMTRGTRYSGRSNIKTSNTSYYIRKNLLEAINGKDANSFINRWGGEILYDDFSIVINEKIGGDYGVKILYGKNMEYVRERTNMETVVTRIIPVSYNGHMLPGDNPWVDSPLINKYTHVYTKVIEYKDVKLLKDAPEDKNAFASLELMQEELVKRAQKEFEAGIDKPKVTIEVNMIDLSSTKEYKEYEELETVALGDTVTCEHHTMKIASSARVIEQKYDCIQKRNIELIIGDVQYSYFSNVNSIISSISQNIDSDGNLMAEKVAGILDGIQTQIRLQSSVAKKVNGRAFTIEDLDEDSALYGAMIFGTQGLQIATQRTEDGWDWDWTTAVTAKGITADAIITGILTDRKGKNYWNLDTGEFSASAGQIKEYIDEYDETLDQEKIYAKLTGGNEEQGIYIKDGRVYINATYIIAGMLAGKYINAKGLTVKDNDQNITLQIDEDGKVSISAQSFKLSGKTIGDIVDDEFANMTQAEIMNKLTGGSSAQGIYLSGKKIYINGEYIKALSVVADAIAAGAVTADKISVTDLSSLNATIGGWKISTNVIYSPSVNDNVGAVALYSGGGTTESYLQFRHLENGSWTNDIKISGTSGVRSGAGTNSLSLIRRPALTSDEFSDGTHHTMGSTYFKGYVQVDADFKVASGRTKSVQRDTENYGTQDFYCYETPSPCLGDFGEGIISEDGLCYIDIDDIFRESVNTEITYYVFLQKEGIGECWIKERCETFFVVEGTPGLKFAYEIKAKQKDLEHIRFADGSRNPEMGFSEIDYELVLEDERQAEIEEMENAYGEHL